MGVGSAPPPLHSHAESRRHGSEIVGRLAWDAIHALHACWLTWRPQELRSGFLLSGGAGYDSSKTKVGVTGNSKVWHLRIGDPRYLPQQGLRVRRWFPVPGIAHFLYGLVRHLGIRITSSLTPSHLAMPSVAVSGGSMVGRRSPFGPNGTAVPKLFTVRSRAMSIGLFETGRGLLLLAAPVVIAVRIVLWVLPSATILRIVRRLGTMRAPRARPSRPPAERVTWAVEAVSRRIPKATCLTQAVSAQLLLRQFGYDSNLCLGVARSPRGEFSAHAWLERDGSIVIGGAEAAVFTRLPALGVSDRPTSGVGTA